jgi:hypothetical protein
MTAGARRSGVADVANAPMEHIRVASHDSDGREPAR